MFVYHTMSENFVDKWNIENGYEPSERRTAYTDGMLDDTVRSHSAICDLHEEICRIEKKCDKTCHKLSKKELKKLEKYYLYLLEKSEEVIEMVEDMCDFSNYQSEEEDEENEEDNEEDNEEENEEDEEED